MKTSLKFKKFASFAKLLKSRLAGRGRSDTSTVASNNDLILDLSKWEKVDVSDCMSNFDLFLLRHSITLSYTVGYSASMRVGTTFLVTGLFQNSESISGKPILQLSSGVSIRNHDCCWEL